MKARKYDTHGQLFWCCKLCVLSTLGSLEYPKSLSVLTCMSCLVKNAAEFRDKTALTIVVLNCGALISR